MSVVVGDHDPVVMSGGRLGVWAECECGWIGPGCYSESVALKTHDAHVARVAGTATS